MLDRTVRPRAFWHKVEAHLPRLGSSRADRAGGPDFHRMLWGEAAAAVGLPVTDIAGGFFEIRCPGAVLRVRRNITSLDDAVTVGMAANKPLVDLLLATRGVPVPAHLACDYRDVAGAWAFVRQRGRPCVVKPAEGTGGGTGITMDVSTRNGLLAAMGRAGSHCDRVMIEEQVPGDNYRLLYIDGVLVDALLRRPPRLLGDGVSTVKQLIAAQMTRATGDPDALRVTRPSGCQTRRAIAQTGRPSEYVPSQGEPIQLRRLINMDDRQDNESVTDSMCAAIVEAGAAAAAAVGVRLAGVDVITPDRSVPLRDSRGAVIEVNTGPGLHYHYMTSGESTPVAAVILRHLCESMPRPAKPHDAPTGRTPE
jgi:D-alanine-D-alanine ligase-like ATP-grasp enzyme